MVGGSSCIAWVPMTRQQLAQAVIFIVDNVINQRKFIFGGLEVMGSSPPHFLVHTSRGVRQKLRVDDEIYEKLFLYNDNAINR